MSVRPSVSTSISRTSIRPTIFRFLMITWVNVNGFSPIFVYALILWRYGFGLLMGKFHLLLTKLSARDTPIFSFLDDNLCKCQRILTKLGTCIDIKEIWFGITNEQISPMFDRVICPQHGNGGELYFNIFIWVITHQTQPSFLHVLLLCSACNAFHSPW